MRKKMITKLHITFRTSHAMTIQARQLPPGPRALILGQAKSSQPLNLWSLLSLSQSRLLACLTNTIRIASQKASQQSLPTSESIPIILRRPRHNARCLTPAAGHVPPTTQQLSHPTCCLRLAVSPTGPPTTESKIDACATHAMQTNPKQIM